jgi:hypothetical protein
VLPGATIFLWQATGSRVQANWPAILYPAACIAAVSHTPAGFARWRVPAIALGGLLAVLVYIQATFAPLPLARRHDPTLARLGGWDDFAALVEAERRRVHASFVAAEEYGLASQLALRLPPGVPVVALDGRWAFFNLREPPPGVTGLLVRSERRTGPPNWPAAEAVGLPGGLLVRQRGGIEAERYRSFLVETRSGPPPTALLPRPSP